jgi:hypothetical protein
LYYQESPEAGHQDRTVADSLDEAKAAFRAAGVCRDHALVGEERPAFKSPDASVRF